jgi:cell division protein FtsZ
MTGLINLDFADVKAVMQNAGTALMAVGEARGEGRAVAAARAAISSPLLDVSIDGARGVLLNVSGGPDLTLAEVTEAAETIQAAVDPEANIFFGAVIHPRVQDEIRVTVIATGLKEGGSGHAVAAPHRAPARAPAPAPEPAPPPREPEPRPRFNVPDASRERDLDAERRRPAPTEWERGRPRQEPPRAPQPPPGDDDWDVPSFLRRPRR